MEWLAKKYPRQHIETGKRDPMKVLGIGLLLVAFRTAFRS